ncbi:MAG: DNA/RNA non-specific endonuclease, partial [Lutibacter sp.]
VAYELTKEKTNKKWERTDKFLTDPKVKTGTANNKDYSGSGYDRGHLAPASDMGWSETSMLESFYYSNMSPQEPGFNRGIWKRLEELVRTWAIDNESIYVVTAPILTTGLVAIGKNKVSIPKYFYKVILDYREPSIKGIGFIIPNGSSSESLQFYAVSIDSVQKFTGIDFFPSLPDEQENIIESALNLKYWNWKSSNIKDGKEKKKATASVQCNGLTKSGIRCKNKTLNISGYCYRHEEQINIKTDNLKTTMSNETTDIEENEKATVSVQCNGLTKKGTRCKNKTLNSNGYCYRHIEQIDNKNESVKTTQNTKTKEIKNSNSSYSGGRIIQTGPRGGKYYINKNGNKTYVKKKY